MNTKKTVLTLCRHHSYVPKQKLGRGCLIRAKTRCMAILAMSVMLMACQDQPNTARQTHDTQHAHSPTPMSLTQSQPLGIYSPTQAINKGQESAINHFIAKQWQVHTINDTQTPSVIIDLSTFGSGHGHVHTGCNEIYFELDTAGMINNNLSIKHIQRELTDCPDEMGDEMMRILGDMYGYKKQGEQLVIYSLKDEMTLTPKTPAPNS